jgi:hypothetical protein
VSPEERQWSHDKDIILLHPPERTDSFVLYIKTTILLSRVKTFNVRYKGRYHAGETAFQSPSNKPRRLEEMFDPRDTEAFQELNSIVLSFRPSWPSHLKDPIQDGMVDPHLYAASVGSYVYATISFISVPRLIRIDFRAQILLHDPHMRPSDPRCPSANAIFKAARGILELIYGISSTSYDVSLLDQLPLVRYFDCAQFNRQRSLLRIIARMEPCSESLDRVLEGRYQ